MQQRASFPAGFGVCSALADETGLAPSTIQLLAMGANPTRNGKPMAVLIVADLAHAQAIVSASLARAGATDIVIDYDHQTVVALDKGSTAKAAGWVKRLYATEAGVFADVEWTEDAAEAIAKREYRYISPFYTFRADGRVTSIINAGLTNTPNFDLSEVQLAAAASALGLSSTEEENPDMINLKAIASALGLGEDADEAAIIAAIAAQKTAMTAIASALGVQLGDDLTALASAATALKSAADAGAPDPAKFVAIDVVTKLQEDNAAVASQLDGLLSARRADMISQAVTEGRLPPALKAHAESIKDEPALASFLAALPATGLGKPTVDANGAPTDGKITTLTADQQAVATAFGLSEADMLKQLNEEAN